MPGGVNLRPARTSWIRRRRSLAAWCSLALPAYPRASFPRSRPTMPVTVRQAIGFFSSTRLKSKDNREWSIPRWFRLGGWSFSAQEISSFFKPGHAGRPRARTSVPRVPVQRCHRRIAAARARGKRPGRQPLDPEKIAAALGLVKAGLSPTVAARQLGLGRSTVYREVSRAGIARQHAGADQGERGRW
jgi:Homeodomain-like domain